MICCRHLKYVPKQMLRSSFLKDMQMQSWASCFTPLTRQSIGGEESWAPPGSAECVQWLGKLVDCNVSHAPKSWERGESCMQKRRGLLWLLQVSISFESKLDAGIAMKFMKFDTIFVPGKSWSPIQGRLHWKVNFYKKPPRWEFGTGRVPKIKHCLICDESLAVTDSIALSLEQG